MKHVKAETVLSLIIVALFFAGTIALYLLYFTWMVLASTGLLLFLFLKELAVDIRRIRQHQRNGDRVDAHPMVDLPAQEDSSPVLRPSY